MVESVLLGIVLVMKGVQGYFSKKLSGSLEKRTTYVTYLVFNLFFVGVVCRHGDAGGG